MPAVRKILIAVKDPQSRSLPAVTKGAVLARAFGASVELFHCISEPVLLDAWFYANGAIQKLQQDTKDRHAASLEVVAETLRKQGVKVSVSADWDYPAHEAVVRRARRGKADLIIAECHAGRRSLPWLLHLTDWELLRTSPIPVMLVKNAQPWNGPTVLAAIDPTHSFAKPAKLDAQILKLASTFSDALKGSLHVMHSYIPVPIGAVPNSGTSPLAISDIAEAMATRAKKGFDRTLASTRIPRASQHLVQGMPADAIPRVAADVKSDIVVMGAISRSGIRRVLIGNTAERVLNALSCDVLVVKPTRFKARVSPRSKGMNFVGLPPVGATL
jgi:universal stress protein E